MLLEKTFVLISKIAAKHLEIKLLAAIKLPLSVSETNLYSRLMCNIVKINWQDIIKQIKIKSATLITIFLELFI